MVPMARATPFYRSIDEIESKGITLVFPAKNRSDVFSLWKTFYPRTPLRWEWSDDGDDKVFKMWQLMKELSDCEQVVYSKWYQGRATFFSRSLFSALLRFSQDQPKAFIDQPEGVRALMDCLEEDSPLSTKELKARSGLKGQSFAAVYNRSIKWCFLRFLVVGFGEVEDGAFPSLLIGSTRLIYEDLVHQAGEMSQEESLKIIDRYMPKGSSFRRQLDRIFVT